MAPDVSPRHLRAVVVMGVSGAGKSEIGARLADRLGWAFADADDEHPERNRRKMSSGVPLDDADRGPWLERLRRKVVEHLTGGGSLVLACSALKASYRDALAGGDARVLFLHLEVPRDVLARRLESRRGHWFAPSLLDTQLESLEPPTDAVVVDATSSIEEVVDSALAALAPRIASAS